MRHSRRSSFFFSLLFSFCAAGAAWGSGDERVSVAVLPNGTGLYRVSVLYPRMVDRARGQAEIAQLWGLSGWSPSAVEWVTSPAFKRFPAQTSIEFNVATLYPKGEFPVEALAVAYRRWGGVNVTAAPGTTFKYTGLAHYENADAAMDVATGVNALSVSVKVKNPELQRLHFTTLSGPAAPAVRPPHSRRVPVSLVILLAVLIAAVVWVLAYAILIGKKA